jgi:hypothetical protein
MAFTVTARHSGTNAETAATSLTTASTTPTASSLFIAAYGGQMDAFGTVNLPEMNAPTGGSLSYTLIERDGDTTGSAYLWGSTNGFWTGGACYRADIGGSPASFAVTVDPDATANTFAAAVCFDITGHNTGSPIVQAAANGANINPESSGAAGSVTLGAAPTNGNLIVVVFFCGVDSAGGATSPTAGAGNTFTALGNNQSARFCAVSAFYRVADGDESATISTTDLGESVGNYVAVAFEVAAAGGGNNFTQTPTDNLGLTDATDIGETKGLPADILGLADVSVALGFGAAVTNSLGLTDATVVEKVLAQAPADTEGLTDSAAVDEVKAPVDTEGLTDTAALVVDFGQLHADTEGLTDTAQVSLAGAGSINTSSTLGVTDAIFLDQGEVSADSLGLTDAATLETGRSVADTVGLSDTVSITASGSVSAVDAIGVTESTTIDQGHAFADGAGMSDAAIRLLEVVKTIIDNAPLADTAQVQLNPIANVTPRPFTGITPRPFTGVTDRP